MAGEQDVRPVDEKSLKRKTRRSFLVLAGAYLAGFAGWRWLLSREDDQGTSWPLRKMFLANEAATDVLNSKTHLNQDTTPIAKGAPFRTNGFLGIDSTQDLAAWRLVCEIPDVSPAASIDLELKDLKSLPQVSYQVEFRCIEGWSQPVGYEGVRFSDFLDELQKHSKDMGDLRSYEYVALETPDAEYYTSIDMASMLHPQTVLAMKMNGEDLTDEHGAPVRLMIPIKYGIKNLKRVGRIFFSNTRPHDYWAERGYDWFSGL
jgi:DMSO/TMAO reductase YedYZ molybdopterin-dependent catalytic subunit